MRLKLSGLAQPVPDVIADARRIESPYPTEPFDLCIEILLPGDEAPEVFGKAAHYLDWQIRAVWIIDPYKRKAYSMTLEFPSPIEIGMDGVLTAGSGDRCVTLPLTELFGAVDEMIGA